MTRDELFEKLKPLAIGLQNTLTSKQHAFNASRNIVDECKFNGINNKLIVEAINSHLSDNEKITLTYFKNLLARSKSKSDTTITKRTSESLSKDSLSASTKTEASVQAIHSKDEIADYMKACFGAERLAIRAMEAGVSIDTIKSWKCPNQISLGTRLSNHIQNQ